MNAERPLMNVIQQWLFGQQVLKCIDKDPEGNVTSKDMMGVLFVPLRDSTVTSSDSPHHDESEL